ncbi:hypothetical protein U1Q18_009559, partial [Sarracenia purpurea var. burkii]
MESKQSSPWTGFQPSILPPFMKYDTSHRLYFSVRRRPNIRRYPHRCHTICHSLQRLVSRIERTKGSDPSWILKCHNCSP